MGRLIAVIVGIGALIFGLSAISGGETNISVDQVPPGDTSVPAPDESATVDPSSADEVELTVDMEVAQIGDDFIRFRIASSANTAFTSVITADGEILITQEGLLNAGEVLTERIEGLEPGTIYTVQSTLIGPPAITSTEVLFRTNGDVPDPEVDAQTAQVDILDLAITDLGPTHVQFDYFSNVCANGSFVVVHQESGEEVGRNDGGPESCVTRSLGVPGQWTPPLLPETTYVITINMEANGTNRGRQYGNVDTETLVVTTPPRPTPDDPALREVAPVQFMSVEWMETTDTTVRVDYSTNVCTNGSFVIREVGGSEVGRHPGSPTGCSTQHSAIAGLWTDPLQPGTDYVIVLTAEADGDGQGTENTATESIDVRTFPVAPAPENVPEQVIIEQIDTSVGDDGITATIQTSSCVLVQVTSLERLGTVLAPPTQTTECSDTTEVPGIPTSENGDTVLVITVEGEELGPGEPNRASEVIIVSP